MVVREGQAMRQLMRLRSKLSAIVCATILASAVSASAKDGETRTCAIDSRATWRLMLITLCSRVAKLSNNIVQKRLAFGRDWSGSVVNSGQRSAASSATGGAAKPSQQTTIDPKRKNANHGSKQSRVIGMLQSPAGATIAAMMQATGWQQHSMRGFLAGVVRKRLKLKLGSKKVDGTRVYRIAGVESSKHRPRKTERQSP